MTGPHAAAPLRGVRVLDLTNVLAGPFAAYQLALLGADVIKVETPEGGDLARQLGADPDLNRRLIGASFLAQNAGKRSIAIDLKHPEGRQVFLDLVKGADALVENFRPGVMGRLGLGAEALRAHNPRLVYASISGYGQQGPARERAAYAMIVQAASGYERTLARYAGDRTRPAATANFVADVLGGLNAFAAIQAALVQRARTGVGQVVDVALMDSMLNLLIYELQEAQFPVPDARPTYGPVAALDGDVLIVPITQRNFDALAEVAALPELRSDPRLASVPSRGAHWQEMMRIVERWTRTRTVDEVLRLLDAAGVPCARYAEPGELLNDGQAAVRALFAPVRDAAGVFTGVGAPWRLSAGGGSIGARVADLGEDRADVLRDWLDR